MDDFIIIVTFSVGPSIYEDVKKNYEMKEWWLCQGGKK